MIPFIGTAFLFLCGRFFIPADRCKNPLLLPLVDEQTAADNGSNSGDNANNPFDHVVFSFLQGGVLFTVCQPIGLLTYLLNFIILFLDQRFDFFGFFLFNSLVKKAG